MPRFTPQRAPLCFARVAVSVSLIVALATAGGCVSKSWKGLSLGFPPIPFRFNITLNGPPPRVILSLASLDPAELSMINLDGYFPLGTTKLLVAEDGYLAGLYQSSSSAAASREPAESPDGTWTLERHRVVQRGLASHVLTVENVHTRRTQHHWSTGKFVDIFWAPDNRAVALNELPAGGDWTARLLRVDTGELIEIERRTPGLTPFFSPAQLERSTAALVRRWVAPSLLIVRVSGPNRADDRLPEWGYELLVDPAVPAPEPNSRVLRAFVREGAPGGDVSSPAADRASASGTVANANGHN